MRRTAGFSLLEALVALAIAALCLIPLMSLTQTFVDGHRRYDEALQKAEIQKNALTILRQINPTDEPEGQAQMPPDLVVSWTATPISDLKTSTGYPAGDGQYQVQLYRLDAQVTRAGQPAIPDFSVERVGWTLGQTAAAPALK
ncbi:MAG TPA: prepilin-type N-terminal cleavage/methylation domain-containing protein [Caulobacteraceae bacterium]|nr:prepilin-type N-terminal cleavage/methylation domain-containing protein [Caulobacteraceae bacterium]